LGFFLAFFALTAVAEAQIDGFTEPFRKIELASDESGSIAELMVEEGQYVQKNDKIAQLDSRVQEIQLEIAEHLADTRSQLVAAEEGYQKRIAIREQLKQLKAGGHASHSEIIRADMELSIAKAKLLSAKEEVTGREIEKRHAEVQLERRTVLAPFDSVVAKVHRQEGEFLSPLRPEIVTLVQVDRLIARFAVPSSQVTAFIVGQTYNIQLNGTRTVVGVVHSVGVETDAQSGTVEIKLVIENQKLEFRSGEICTLNI
jgi:RND family efflux transporter MFP subunit